MYNISDELRARFENGERKSARITLNGITHTDLIITDADIVAGGFSIDRYCATGSKIEIGSAVSAELSLTLNNNDGRFNDVVFEGSILKVEIGIKGVTDSYIPCGFFTVDEPPRAFSTIKLKALDFMMRFDKAVNLGDLGSNHTVETLVEKCAELCLVNISPNLILSELPNADKSVAIPSTASTYRQLLQWAAQLTGTCAYIDWNGELMLSWFVDTLVEITTAHRYSGDVLESDIEITGVTIKNESVTVVSGTEEYPLVIEGNGLIIDDEEAKVQNIASAVKGFKYRPYECSCVAMPYLYPLDKIVYIDKNDNEISTVITNHTFGLNDTSSLAAQGETAAKNSYAQQVGLTKAEVDNAIAEAIKKVNHNTEYFYVRYSAYADGKNSGVTSMTDKITADTVYLGTCATNSSVAPADADSYDWVKIRGADGKTPVKDVDYFDGKDGGTLQVKYKSSATVPTITSNNIDDWGDTVPTPSAGQRVYMTQKLSTETNWSTPIQISAEDGTTPTVTINSNGYWVINGETTAVKAQGENGKTPTITVGENGNWLVDGKDTNTKAQGAQGKDGADIEYIYYRKTALGTPSTPTASTTIYAPTSTAYNKWTSSPCGITETYKYEYVSVRTKAAGAANWGNFSTPVIWSSWGEKGTDGDGIEYKYFIASTPGVYNYTAGDQTWTDDPTGVDKDWMYEYVVQIKHKGDGSTEISNPGTLWAKWGATGDKGVSVTEVITEYHKSTSDQTPPATNSTGWTTSAPLWADGYFLWTRLKTILSDGSVEYSNPVVDASWKKVTVVEKASKELNQVLANALGLYVTEQNGVRYYHSNPNLTSSKSGDTILVLNASGFGVCKNGWNSGNPVFDHGTTFDGKAIWDILVANKISADLIEAGSIKSLDNAKIKTEINLDTGEVTFDGSESILGIKGSETNSNGVNFPEGMWIQSKSEDSQWVYTLSSGVCYFTKAYYIELMKYYLNLITKKPVDPYYSEITQQDIKTANLHCKNIYIVGDSDGNEYNLMDALSMMSEQVSLLSESLTTLQEKYLALEDALGQQHEHTPATAIKENIVNATCTAQGSYDEVVYCAACGDEISRTKKYTAKIAHNYVATVTKQPTCTATGTRKHTCSSCGAYYTEEISATNHTDSNGDGYCDVCNTKVGTFYKITVQADPSNGGTVSGGGDYLSGSTATVTATPASGYKFAGWYYNDSKWSSNASYSFTVSSTRTLTAKFDRYYTVTIAKDPTNGGVVKIGGAEASVGSYTFKKDSQITLSAEPASGYEFEKWVVNNGYATYTSSSLTQTVNADLTYKAVFKAKAPTTYQTLANNATTTINVTPSTVEGLSDVGIEQFTLAKFVAPSNGTYTFESTGRTLISNSGTSTSTDPCARLYDSSKSTILGIDDDSAGSSNFKIEKELTAGTTYYLAVKFYRVGITGTVDVKVTAPSGGSSQYMTAQISAVNAGSDESYHLARNADGTNGGNISQTFEKGESFYYFASTGSKKIASVQVNENGSVTNYTAESLVGMGVLSADYTTLSYPWTVATYELNTTVSFTVYFEQVSVATNQVEIGAFDGHEYRGSVTVTKNGVNITNSQQTYSLNVGDTIIVTATPNTGNSFTFWNVNNGKSYKSDNPYTFIVNSDTERVAAMFKTG